MLLAIDTATRVLSLALYDGWQIRAEMSWITPNHHTTELTPGIHQMLGYGGCQMTDIKVLAVSQGPGSFNGLRVGVSAAKGLALALHIPLIAVPTLDIVAAAQPPFEGALIAVAEAGRGRVCAGRYLWNGKSWVADMVEGMPDVRIVEWQALVAEINTPTLIAGEVESALQPLIEGKPIVIAPGSAGLRRAGFLAGLAWSRWQRGDFGDAAAVVPFYLHRPGVPHP